MLLQAEPSALDRTSPQIATIRGSLTEEHAMLRAQVEGLLGADWTGQAAVQFRRAWERWCEGMADVLSGLELEGAAIGLARAELVGTDDERAAAGRLLHERLGER